MVRFYLQVQACGHAYAAVFCLSLLLWAPCDRFGTYFCVGFTALLLLASWDNYRSVKNEPEKLFVPPPDAPVDQQIAFCHRSLMTCVIVFAVASIAVIVDLSFGRHFDDDSDLLQLGLAVIYRHCGYWVTVLCFPMAGLFTSWLMLRRIRRLKKSLPTTPFPITRF